MEVLLKKETIKNDLNDDQVMEKWKQCNSDPFTLKIKPEFILVTKNVEPNKPTAEKSNEIDVESAADQSLNENNKKPAGDQEPSTTEDGHKSKKFKKTESKRQERKNIMESRENRLCSSLAKCQECAFGDKCRYPHDVDKWLETKPADISSTCYLFETYGRCPFGVSCRFGSSHVRRVAPNVYENLTKETSTPAVCRVYNVLGSELRTQLWKKKYDFSLTYKIVKTVEQFVNANWAKDGLKYNRNRGVFQKKNQSDNSESINEENVEKAEVSEESTNEKTNENKKDQKKLGSVTEEDLIKLRPAEKKKIDWKNKLYLAPLTTCGNLPFRRICKELGADITCSEMAMSSNLLQGQASEWALLKRHPSEDLFGVQLAGAYADQFGKACQIIKENFNVDFVDINSGCPIDLIFDKGAGCALMTRLDQLNKIITSLDTLLDVPVTLKIRTGIKEDVFIAHELVSEVKKWGVSMITLHGRTRQQRYSKLADWDYIEKCAKIADPIPLFGCGDILTYRDYEQHMTETSSISGCMIARGALYKPWLFTEIKEKRDWDISAGERLDLLKKYVNYGLEHWGSDNQGVETTRRFLLEWLSFLYRYVPVGVLETLPQRINLRPPFFFGRNELETLMASPNCSDWIKISEFLLGPVPTGYQFTPKHKANAY